MSRLETAYNPGRERLSQDSNCHQYFVKASTDKLRVLGEGLLDVLLYLGSLPLVSVTAFLAPGTKFCVHVFFFLIIFKVTFHFFWVVILSSFFLSVHILFS